MKQSFGLDAERTCKLADSVQAGIAHAALHATDERPVHLRPLSQLLLRKVQRLSKTAHAGSELWAKVVHSATSWRALIRVDIDDRLYLPTSLEGAVMRKLSVALGFVFTAAATLHLGAISAGDVLNRMGDQERVGYITGIVDTFLYTEQLPTKAPTARSHCILSWFYGQEGRPGIGGAEVVSFFRRYPDQPPVGLISILIDRHCGTKDGKPPTQPLAP